MGRIIGDNGISYAVTDIMVDKELLDKINTALDKIKANGEYDKLLKKYFK